MDYKVLYRKYRPDDFNNIIDQDYIIRILKNSIKQNKLSHAYIFSGPRGTGKTTTAKVLAKTLNCMNPTETGPCGKCEMCQMFGSNPDIIELDAASNNGVDEVREIIENAKFSPTFSKYKVYIIDEVHMMTNNAFNALLLTLEEPPKNVIFILATTNIESVPITILSRCQRFDFKKISFQALFERLKYVCEKESIDATDEALEEIASLAEGGMRDALSILDQVQMQNDVINLESVQSVYSIVPTKSIDGLLLAIETNDGEKISTIVRELQSLGINYKSLVKKTIEILEKKAVSKINDKDYNSYEMLAKLILRLNSTLNETNIYISSFVLYELAFLDSISEQNKEFELPNLNSVQEIHIKKEIEEEKPLPKMDKQKPDYFPGNNSVDEDNKKIRLNNCFVGAKKELLNEIKKDWQNFISSVNDNKILSLLIDSTPVAASEIVLVLSTQTSGSAELINIENIKIEKLIKKYFKKEIIIVATDEFEWQNCKQKYISDLKNGVRYEMIEEKKKENKKNDIEDVAKDIFDANKIEIKEK